MAFIGYDHHDKAISFYSVSGKGGIELSCDKILLEAEEM